MVDLQQSLRPTGTTAPRLPVREIAARVRRRKRRRRASAAGLAAATMGIAVFAIARAPAPTSETITVADGARDESAERSTGETAGLPSDPRPPVGDGTAAATSPTGSTDPEAPSGEPDRSRSTSPRPSSDDTGSTTSPTAPPENGSGGSASDGPHPLTTPGIRTRTAPTSEWADGYCLQVEVANDSSEQIAWQVGLDLDGTIATLWNAAADDAGGGTFVFSGQDGYNATIGAGATTSFGTCVDTDTDTDAD